MRAWKKLFAASLLAAAALLLSACGFELRGSSPSSALPFATLYIDNQVGGVAAVQGVALDLKRRLSRSGATTVVDERKAAEAIVQIQNEVRERVILSLNSQGRVREYTLNYRVTFRLLDPAGRELRPSETVQVQRTLTFNENQVLAKEGEEQSLYRDMQSDMVGQLLRRIGATRHALPATAQQVPATSSRPSTPPTKAQSQPQAQPR